jgi:uncharacterized protein (UPF0218 family)
MIVDGDFSKQWHNSKLIISWQENKHEGILYQIHDNITESTTQKLNLPFLSISDLIQESLVLEWTQVQKSVRLCLCDQKIQRNHYSERKKHSKMRSEDDAGEWGREELREWVRDLVNL